MLFLQATPSGQRSSAEFQHEQRHQRRWGGGEQLEHQPVGECLEQRLERQFEFAVPARTQLGVESGATGALFQLPRRPPQHGAELPEPQQHAQQSLGSHFQFTGNRIGPGFVHEHDIQRL